MNTKALLEPMGSWAWWRSWFLIFLGCSIMGAGFVLFVNPYNFVPGGVYGMGIVLHNIFPSIQVGTFGYMFDVPLMLTAMLVFGGQFGTRTVLAALYTPGFMNMLTRLVYPDAAAVESLDPALLLGGRLDLSNDLLLTCIIGAVVIIAYTVLGGFLAVSTTDLVQSIFMTVALIVVVCFGVGQAGGVDAVLENARSLPGYLDLTQGYDVAAGSAASFGTLSILSTLAWGLGYFGMPHILLRFMAIREEKELNLSRRIATVWVVISMAIAIAIGVIGLAVTKAGSIPFLGSSAEAETIIIQLANLMSQHGFLLIIAILAATMSTADSQLLAAASSVSQDLMQDFFGIKLSAKTTMLVARVTVLVIAVISIFLAWDPNSSVFRVVSFAWAGFGPVVLFALFWKRSNKWGALAGMVSGGVMVFVWKYLIAPMGGAWSIYELLPAFLVASVAIVVVSLLTPAPEKAIVDEFEAVRGK